MAGKAACCLIAVAIFLPFGCTSSPGTSSLPAYAALDAPAAEQILAQRAAAVHTLTAQCQLTLTRPDGQSVRLDGVMVLAAPDRLRLRVWKFNQAVFDLTLRPDGLWTQVNTDAEAHGPVIPASISAGQLARFLSWFQGGYFTSPGLTVTSSDDAIILRRRQPDGSAEICMVDRATATARQFKVLDPTGRQRFSLSMTDYRDISGFIWPLRLSATSSAAADQGGGRIDVVFTDLEFNGDLAPGAFVPPADAQRRP